MAPKKPTCHPTRVHYAKGKCKSCYNNSLPIKASTITKKNSARNEWALNNKDRIKDNGLKRKYGISFAEVEAMKVAQENRCAICGEKDYQLNVDHHHDTATVRALLCAKCNKGIGLLKECTRTLLAAVRYLLYWETRYKDV